MIHALKYEGGVWLRLEVTALMRSRPDWCSWLAGAALVPVPLHPRKQRQRGYNQSHVIAAAICDAVPGTRLCDCLQRTRFTSSQTLLNREQRLDNMAGAFVLRPGLQVPTARLILVDDVLTTGATLGAARAALSTAGRTSGSRIVDHFTLAHG